MNGLLLLRVLCIQGHSGETMRNMTRFGQELVQGGKHPVIWMHSTVSAHQERICHQGLLPGGPRREKEWTTLLPTPTRLPKTPLLAHTP